jgi:hypothetical protein
MTEDRGVHHAIVRLELEDVTDEEAAWFWRRLAGDPGHGQIEIDGLEAQVAEVQPLAIKARGWTAPPSLHVLVPKAWLP